MAKVSEGDMQEIQEVVGIFDKVGDGKVDINDIVGILRSLGKWAKRKFFVVLNYKKI